MRVAVVMRLLQQAVAAGNLNLCCGLLRRLCSESAQHDDDSAIGSSSSSDTLAPRALLQHVIALGRSCVRFDASKVQPSSLDVLCHLCQRTGAWEAALHFCTHFAPQRPPSPVFLASLLTPDNVQAVLALCARRGWQLDVASAIRVLAMRHGSWSSALTVAQDAERRLPHGERYTFAVLIPHLAAGGSAMGARALFDAAMAQGVFVEPGLVQELLRQAAALRQWQMCLYMLQALRTTHEAAQLLPARPAFFHALMDSLPTWQSALTVLQLAHAMEVRPDERMVGALLLQCEQAGAWQVATMVYDMAVREGFVDSVVSGRGYQALVRSFSTALQWEKALQALSWMSKASDASCLAGVAELVELCERAGQWQAALTVGQGLLEHRCELLAPQTSLSLLLACARGAQWGLATRLYRRQLHHVHAKLHPLALCATLQACNAAKQWAEALSIFAEARKERPRVLVPPMAHRLAIKACVSSGQWQEAMTLLRVMREDGLPQDNHCQRLGLWAAALEGQWQLSLAYLRRLPQHTRSQQDRVLVRNTTRAAGPTASAIALRYLQGK